jgi:hypothetical protein
MSDANKSSGLPKPETEADWVIDLDKLAEETGTPSALSVVTVPPVERSQPNSLLDGMTGTEFFRLASESPTDSSLTQVQETVTQVAPVPQIAPGSQVAPVESFPSPGAQSYEELQQQNEQLLDWVSELEESLNQCQTALQFQRQRSQELEAIVAQRQKSESIASLEASFNRTLQEAHQQVQKQKILVETLTQQLDNSKDRVAHLEQEYASLQKRFADQTQRLVQSENECRALKTRLSRQQRYTLQFKAALERCLEVSVPLPADIEAPEDCKPALPEPVTFFPRSSPVQAWSAPGGTEDTTLEGSWQKVTQWVDPDQPDASNPASEINDPVAAPFTLETPIDLPQHAQTDPIVDPIIDPPIVDPINLAIDPASGALSTPTAEPIALDHSTHPWTEEQVTEQDPALPSQVSSVETFPVETSPSPVEPLHSLHSSVSLPSLDPLNLDAALQAVINHRPSAPPEEMKQPQEVSSASTPSAEPYQLWQTLAQASEEPAVPPEKPAALPPNPSKVKLIAFPSPKGATDTSLQSPAVPDNSAVSAPVSNPALGQEPVEAIDREPVRPIPPSPEIRRTPESTRKVAFNPLLETSPSLNLQPSWPSPLVYPLRPPKKRNSLAAIELPRFPRQ